LAAQLPSHVALQFAAQLNVPGVSVQLASQLPAHDPVHPTSAVAVHWPVHPTSRSAAHEASTFGGVQSALHPPEVSTLHLAVD
jgi:hypothetical protein